MTVVRRSLPGYGVRIVVGAILSILGIVWSIVCVSFSFSSDAKLREGIGANVAFAMLFLLPGLLLYLTGRARRAREERMLHAAELASAAGRVPVGEVAVQLGVPMHVARQALVDAVGVGRLLGRLDVERDVFTVLAEATAGPAREVSFICRGCGGSSSALVVPGESPRCGYCGAAN